MRQRIRIGGAMAMAAVAITALHGTAALASGYTITDLGTLGAKRLDDPLDLGALLAGANTRIVAALSHALADSGHHSLEWTERETGSVCRTEGNGNGKSF